jgi:chemotaxis signal transduction protein
MRPITLDAGDRYCVLRQGAAWFAVPAVAVREVLPRPALTPVPGANDSVAGLCHLRTGFLPVLSFQAVLGESDTRSGGTTRTQLLVMCGVQGEWGMLVDEVAGLDTLEICMHSDSQLARDWTSAILGTATSRDRVVSVLDPGALYRYVEEELKRHQEDLFAGQSNTLQTGEVR